MQGVLVLVLPPGGYAADEDLNMVMTFAGQAALALERARAQEERELIMVLEDRERIARDLHDVVIQRLFATGLVLQSTIRLAVRDEVRERLATAVDDLDTTIRDIRRAIFELSSPAETSLRSEIAASIDRSVATLGFRPHLSVEGPIDTAVPGNLHGDILAVVREALSNVARHAKARAVDVTISLSEGNVVVAVSDDGAGLPDGERPRPDGGEGHGLVNLGSRARDRGGSFRVEPGASAGTVLTWTAPLGP